VADCLRPPGGYTIMPVHSLTRRAVMEPETQVDDKLFEFKADNLPRFVARIIDLLLAVALAQVVAPVGFFAGMTYVLIADGVAQGRSLGKGLIGLRVVSADGQPAGLRESILRNLSMAVGYLMFAVPWIGWLLAGAVMVFEGLLVMGNERGRRLGDDLANTQVINAARSRGESWV
jgi:uncharacterized RDD family membrane protein YckC